MINHKKFLACFTLIIVNSIFLSSLAAQVSTDSNAEDLVQLCESTCIQDETKSGPTNDEKDGTTTSGPELLLNASCNCSSLLPGANDADYAYNISKVYSAYQITFTNNKKKPATPLRDNRIVSICAKWRKSTDSAATRKAINTFPGYTSLTHTAMPSYQVTSTFKFKPNAAALTKGTYFVYLAYESKGGDVETIILKLVIV